MGVSASKETALNFYKDEIYRELGTAVMVIRDYLQVEPVQQSHIDRAMFNAVYNAGFAKMRIDEIKEQSKWWDAEEYSEDRLKVLLLKALDNKNYLDVVKYASILLILDANNGGFTHLSSKREVW